MGLDGSKQPQDLGINANMGVRFAANLGVPVVKSKNFGAQLGVGVNLSDAAVHVLDQIEGTSRRTQTFVTAAFFQQATTKLSWVLGYDYLHEFVLRHVQPRPDARQGGLQGRRRG